MFQINDWKITDLARALEPFLLAQIEQGGAVASMTFGKILLIRAGGAGVSIYAVTAAGLTAALAAASAGDAVWIPPCSITGNFTVPAGVGVQAYGKKADINGTFTLGASSFLNSIYVIPSVNQAGVIVGVIGPAIGRAYLNDCSIIATNLGAGNAIAISCGAGDLWVWKNHVSAVTAGAGDAYGVNREDAGETRVLWSQLEAESSGGANYELRCSAGYIYHKWCSFKSLTPIQVVP